MTRLEELLGEPGPELSVPAADAPSSGGSDAPSADGLNARSSDGPDVPGTGPVLSFRGCARTYPGPPQVRALLPFDLDIPAGGLVTVAGPSGSGKSTWLSLAGLLDRPTSGTVALDGQETTTLSEIDRTDLRGRMIGFVFQAFHLMPLRTVTENVELAGLYQGMDRATRRDQAAEALAVVGLTPRAMARAGQLSGGEQQRVAIARGLVGAPRLLLCDEPTGNLDTATGAGIVTILERLAATGITVVVVTHDPDLAARGTIRVEIRDGRVHVR